METNHLINGTRNTLVEHGRKTMTQNKIAKILIQTIIKELGGKLNGQDQYLDGMGTQFSFDLNGKSYSVDLWDEDIVKEFNK